MKTKRVAVSVCLVAAGLVWIGCSSDSTSTPAGADAGNDATSGGDTGAPPGDDAGSGGSDAAKDAPFDGYVDAPQVDLQFGSCSTFTPCGGDPKGTWKVTSGCVDESVLASAKKNCPTLTTSNVVFKAKGVVTIDAASIDRASQVDLSASVTIPKVCADQVGGDCSIVAAALKTPMLGGFDSATCTSDGAGGCNCDVADSTVEHTNDTYTQSGSTITTGSGNTYDFCVGSDGGTANLTYQDTTANNPLPATFVLEK